MTIDPDASTRPRLVLLASPRELLGSSLRAVLEPHGFRFAHVPDARSLVTSIESMQPDVVILDEDVVDDSLADLGTGSGPGGAGRVPVLLYSSGHWKSGERAGGRHVAAWDVIEEPVRSADLLSRLDRLFHLKSMWDASTTVEPGGATHHLGWLLRVSEVLGAVASRSNSRVGCAVLGPTHPTASEPEMQVERDQTLHHVSGQIRGSDLCAWVGPTELAVILYGAGIDGLGHFVGRIAEERDIPGTTPSLSAGLVILEPGDARRSGRASGPGPDLKVLGQVEAARSALDRARQAGGGVRVAVTP